MRPTFGTTAIKGNSSVTVLLLPRTWAFARKMVGRSNSRLASPPLQTKLRLFMMSHTSLQAEEGSANKQLIDTLLRSRLFRDYESVFTKATGLPLTLRPLDYWQLAHHGKNKRIRFARCSLNIPPRSPVCLQAHENMIRHTDVLPHTVTCPFGLTETAVPVKLGEKTIGYLRIGQVFRRSPSRKRHRTKVKHEY